MNPTTALARDLALSLKRHLTRYLGQLRHRDGGIVQNPELCRMDLKALLAVMTDPINSRLFYPWLYNLAMFASVHLRGLHCDPSPSKIRSGMSPFEELGCRLLITELGSPSPVEPASFAAPDYLSRSYSLRDQATLALCDLLGATFATRAETLLPIHLPSHRRIHRDCCTTPLNDLPLYHLQRLACENWDTARRRFGLPNVSRSLLAFLGHFRHQMAHLDTSQMHQHDNGKAIDGWPKRVFLAMACEEFISMVQKIDRFRSAEVA